MDGSGSRQGTTAGGRFGYGGGQGDGIDRPRSVRALERMPVARYFVHLLDRLGYDAELKVVTTRRYLTTINDPSQHVQIGPFGLGERLPRGVGIHPFAVACDGPFNLSQFCDPEIDARMRKATRIATTDPHRATSSGRRSTTTSSISPPGSPWGTQYGRAWYPSSSATTSSIPTGGNCSIRCGCAERRQRYPVTVRADRTAVREPQLTSGNQLPASSLRCTECVPGQPSMGRRCVSGPPRVMPMTCGSGKAAGQRVAQALICKQGVGGSSPLVSTEKGLVDARITSICHRPNSLSPRAAQGGGSKRTEADPLKHGLLPSRPARERLEFLG